MKSNRTSNLVLLVGLLLTLVAMDGCTTAGGSEGGASSTVSLIIILVAIFGIFYFLMVRPTRQREKRHKAMVEELKRGDMVITVGGIYGQIESISEDSIILKVESGATIRVTKGGILGRPERVRGGRCR